MLHAILSHVDDWVGRRRLFSLARDGRAELPSRYVLRGAPVLEIAAGARLVIGEGVMLDSSQRGYHVAMWGPVRILVDQPGATVSIGEDSRVHASGIHAELSISIGKRCLIAANCQIFDSNGHVLSLAQPSQRMTTRGPVRPIVIEDDVWIGTGSVILPGSHICAGAVVSAGSVVSGIVPPGTLVRGNPATPVLRETDVAHISNAQSE